ncbi:hypothetical protein PV328_008900 [Microctonus aethiopoides]|uniref:Uncharacterized protein n=1 Tax=Microctonus aethiopoides TaxID=144406 RepID=A0AA39KRF5_9HYME|nr:hypothetical protein PV328_008900 [Microctonus aethiopoides]
MFCIVFVFFLVFTHLFLNNNININTYMEGEKKRSAKRRSLEAGREMLARYKESLGRNMEVNQTTEPSDDEILQSNEVDEQSVHHQSTSDCHYHKQLILHMNETWAK